MKSLHSLFLCLAFGANLATAGETPLPEGGASGFVRAYCIDCHNDRKQKGDINLKSFLEAEAIERELLMSVYHQIHLQLMPPEEEDQPDPGERSKVLAILESGLSASGIAIVDKKALPGYGNYVDHEALFGEGLPGSGKVPPPRIWRHSPESFSQRVNRIAGHDVVKFVPVATFPVPQKGLKHP
ncbi:MAG: c-type cytochrome domain-containing protein, partial [Verrucomicrobiota bacterium]